MKIILSFILLCSIHLQAQKFITRTANVNFSSDTPLEKIKAENNEASSVLDIENGNVVFQILIKAFHFEKALMQEHFNENYMESDTYPKATFSGTITNLSAIDFLTDGAYDAEIEGKITIHGVAQDLTTTAIFYVKAGAISASSNFALDCEDFNIEIPSVVRDNIAQSIEISLQANYETFNR